MIKFSPSKVIVTSSKTPIFKVGNTYQVIGYNNGLIVLDDDGYEVYIDHCEWDPVECSDSESEWKDYHEPLARIFREVRKAYPDWKRIVDRNIDWDEGKLINLIINDSEVSCEIETLIRTMVEEVKNEQ